MFYMFYKLELDLRFLFLNNITLPKVFEKLDTDHNFFRSFLI